MFAEGLVHCKNLVMGTLQFSDLHSCIWPCVVMDICLEILLKYVYVLHNGWNCMQTNLSWTDCIFRRLGIWTCMCLRTGLLCWVSYYGSTCTLSKLTVLIGFPLFYCWHSEPPSCSLLWADTLEMNSEQKMASHTCRNLHPSTHFLLKCLSFISFIVHQKDKLQS